MTVALVGAGPGDPGLLTRRGEALLRAADVVVYDRLASPALLELVPPSAERVDVGKAPGRVAMTQDEINAVLVDRGRQGLRVVRLKGGDPFVFGRGGEEAEALRAAGVPFEVVPGVTSAIAAPAYAGIPVTHRGVSTHFIVVTGHEDPAKGGTDTDWDALARGGNARDPDGRGPARRDHHGVDRGRAAGGNTGRRRAVGHPARTAHDPCHPGNDRGPRRRGAERDRRRRGCGARPRVVRAPPALRAHDRRDARREQASELRTRCEALGANVVEIPAIAIEPLPFTVPDLGAYTWLVFTSANGVDAFFDQGLAAQHRDARALAPVQLAAIGPGTARALERRGVHADLVPDAFVAEALLDAFPPGPGRVLLARAEVARDALPDGLRAQGYGVDVLAVYRTASVPISAPAQATVRAGVDAVTFTSSSTVANFCTAIGEPLSPQPIVVSIGPVTSRTAREHGLRVDAEADPHTIDGVVEALLAALQK